MRRVRAVLITTVVGAMTVLAIPAQATVESSSQTGPFASAFFTTAPAEPVPGEVYQDVNVYGDAFTGGEQSGPTGVVDIVQWVVTDAGPQMVSETIAGEQGSAVSFTVDKHLTAASLSIAVTQSKTCYPDGTCVPSAGGSVNVVWNSTGSPVRTLDNTRTLGPGQFVYTAHYRDVTRDASASGSVLGMTFDTSQFGVVGMQSYRERLVTH